MKYLYSQLMHGGKGEKKITVMTKTVAGKRPNLQLNVTSEIQKPMKTAPVTFSSFSAEDQVSSHYKSVSTVTSPTHHKGIKPIVEIAEQNEDGKDGKKPENGMGIQKRGSGKEVMSPKVEVQPRNSAKLLGSPKANIGKEKILISYGSEKNLNVIKPIQKRETPQKQIIRIEQLERYLDDQKYRNGLLEIREKELSVLVQKLTVENSHLQEQNADLKKKVDKYKQINEETKKMLRQRIHSFNEEGGELQALRNQIKTLEDRVTNLLEENQELRLELNKYSDLNMSSLKEETAANVAVSTVKEVTLLQGSRVCGLYLKQSDEGGDLKEFNGMDNMEDNLQLQSYITEKEQSYLEDYQSNSQAFEKIKHEYESILISIENKYKALAEEYQQTIAHQASDLYQLQLKLDQLQEGRGNNASKMSLQSSQMILKAQEQIARLNLQLFELRLRNKELIEESQHSQARCKFLQTALQVQVLKKHFANQNDKFQFNVVKLNLLTIIDKLKLKIDREKEKSQKLKKRKGQS